MSTTVSELATAAKTDNAQFEPLWLAVYRLIVLWAMKYPRADISYDTDDLIQSAYWALFDAVQGFDPEQSEFTTYLRYHVRLHFAKVAGVRTSKRDAANYATTLDEPLAHDTDTTMLEALLDTTAHYAFDDVIDKESARQDCDVMLAEIDKLDEQQKQALLLTAWEGVPLKDVADTMGISTDAVRRHRDRATQKLRNTRAGRLIRLNYYRHVGLTQFKSTFTSSVEAIVLQAERTC